MKKILALVFLFLAFFIEGYSQTQTIYVTNRFGDGAGTLYDAIVKANNSTAASGNIVFNFTWASSFAPLTSDFTIYLSSSLPVLSKNNWTIAKYATIYYTLYYTSPPPPNFPYQVDITVNGINKPGPGLVITGVNSISNIPYTKFINFKGSKYTVTNTNDAGNGSLRQAIQYSLTTTAKDSIAFNIPGAAPYLINLSSALPNIKKNIIIDGSTQPGFIEGKETVVLNGNKLFMGFTLDGCTNVEIYGLTLQNFSNGIGTLGGMNGSNSAGISSITIGKKGKGNIITSNSCPTNGEYGYGILINLSAQNISICNNYVGTNANGDLSLGNARGGMSLAGTCFISENVISGNGGNGINCAPTPTMVNNGMNRSLSGNITKNKIGTDPTGTIALPNNYAGIEIQNVANLVIGGNLPSDKNIISGNKGHGISFLIGYGFTINIVKGSLKGYVYNNYIGTDSSGLNPLPNAGAGIVTDDYNYGIYYIGDLGKGNIIAFNKMMAIYNGNSAVIKNNTIYNNNSGLVSTSLAAPIITNRSPVGISGTAPNGTKVQLFIDNGFNKNAQGKTFVAEVNSNSGTWNYSGAISDPCSITAIAIDTVNKRTSTFSLAGTYSLGSDITVCNGDSVSLDAKAGFSSYAWSTGDTTRNIKVFSPGKYFVTVNNGCTYSDTIEIFYITPPIVNLGNDTTICNGQPLTLNADNPGATYSWSNGSVLQSINVSSTNTYIVKVSFDKCSNRDTIKATVITKPVVNLGQDVFKCDKDSVILNANNSTGYNKYLWSTGDTLQSLKVKVSGTYSVQISNTCFPPSYDTIKISLKAPIVNLGNDTTICTGQSLLLKAPIAGASQKWYDKSYFLYYDSLRTVTATGKYFVTVNLGSCTVSDTIVVTKKPIAAVNLGPDTYICTGDSLILDAGTNATYYQWSTGATSRFITVDTAGTFSVKVSHNSKCSAIDTLKLQAAQCNIISGSLFNDLNQNCSLNTSEPGMPGKIIVLKNLTTSQTYYSYTDSVGNYSSKLPTGNYQVYPAAHKTFAAICPNTYSIALTNTSPVPLQNFGITFNSVQDLKISIGEPSPIRLASIRQIVLSFNNVGTVSSSGKVILVKDPFINIQSSSPAYTQSNGDTLIWDFTNLSPDEYRSISLNFIVPVNNSLIGKYIYNKAIIHTDVPGDINPNNNISYGSSLIMYAYDPNNKITEKGVQGNITINDSLFDYTINFQNIGNDTAYTIIIKDTLSDYLDVLSFEPGAGSHPYKVDISEKGIITWTFKDIMLPDSTTNQNQSSGFVKYSIKIKPNLLPGTVISNSASIYFDLASPVITDTTKHTIVDSMLVQNISFPALSDKEYLDSLINLTTTSNSLLQIQFAWSGPVSIINGKLIINGTGNVRVRAYQEGDSQYYPSQIVDRVFKINKSNQNIQFDSIPDKIITDPSFKLIASGTSSGNPVMFSIISGPVNILGDTLSLTGAIGIVTIKATQPGNINFNDAPDITRTFIVYDNAWVITNPSGSLNYTDTYGSSGSIISYMIHGDNFSTDLTIDAPAGFEVSTDSTIFYTSLSLTPTSGAFPSISKIYLRPTSLIQAGSYNKYIYHSTPTGINVPLLLNITINKAPLTVIANDASRIYGNFNPDLSYSIAGFVAGEDSTLLDQLPVISATADINTSPGIYPISLTGGSDNNYQFTFQNASLSIEKAKLIIQVIDTSRYVGELNPNFSILFFGFVNNEDTSDLDVIPSVSCLADLQTLAGTYAISLSGGMDSNYDFILLNGQLIVNSITSIHSGISKNNITLSPNPASDKIIIAGSGIFNKAIISNSMGVQIAEYTQKEITIDNFYPGIYYVTIFVDKNVQTVKLIISR